VPYTTRPAEFAYHRPSSLDEAVPRRRQRHRGLPRHEALALHRRDDPARRRWRQLRGLHRPRTRGSRNAHAWV